MRLAQTACVAQELTITGPLPEASTPAPRVWLARNLFRESIAPLQRVAGRVAAHASRTSASPGRHELRHRVLLVLERAALASASLLLLAAAVAVHHVYVERDDMPELESFVRFELPGTGEVYDTHGRVLIQLAREYRRSVSYEEVPLVLRQAVLSAEDKNFFSHSGVEYAALPRIVLKSLTRSLSVWWNRRDAGFQPKFPQGGSTLTQQLVRGYFLPERLARENGDTLYPDGFAARALSKFVGVRATNKLLRKLEEIRYALWLEDEFRRRYGSKERAKQEIFARYASFIYLGHGRYGFAAASEYYFGKPLSSYTLADAPKAALLAGMAKSPAEYAPAPGDVRRVRRRNEILTLMAKNGYVTEEVMKRGQAEPLLAPARSPVKTHAPAAVSNVLEELKQYGDGSLGIDDLVEGRIAVHSTVDERVQTVVNEALEGGLVAYEKRHPSAKGAVQGSVVVLRNSDGAVLAESGGRQIYRSRYNAYSDYNRATGSLRQPGSVMKPIVYFAAMRNGLSLDSEVPDEPIAVPLGGERGVKWIANYDGVYKGLMPMRKALAESRNAVAIWLARSVGLNNVMHTARELGIRTPLQPYVTTALGASEVRLIELANVYRAFASGILTDAYAIDHVTDGDGNRLPQTPRVTREIRYDALAEIQEGLRSVVRLPDGTAHALASAEFGIPVMGKTGTTNDFRDALFVGSTYGPTGITVAVRVGFDDNRSLGSRETGGRAALPIFKDVVQRVYRHNLVGPVPQFPREIEERIDLYLMQAAAEQANGDPEAPTIVAPADGPVVMPIGVVAPAGEQLQPLSFPARPRAEPALREQQTSSRPGGEP
jgi:penicillin-binding protein 1A